MYRTSLATKLKLFSRFVRKFSFVCVSENQENLIVDVGKGKEVFPLVWLRDNCRCPSCFHKSSTSRIINWVDFNVSPKATSVQTTSDGNIVLQWNDKHISTFSLDWLKKRSFKEDAQQLYLHDNYRPTKVPWSCETFESIKKTYEYEDLLKSDEVLYNWLFDYARYGIVFINNVPDEKHAAAKLCKRIGVIKSTHYEEEFKIKHIPGTSNVAYLSDALQLHTDLPYYDYVPGVTILHCLIQTDGEGGDNLLVDGLYVAEKLRQENQEAFDLLSSVDVNWQDIGSEHGEKYHTILRCPVIKLDIHGNVDKIRQSGPQRDSHFTVNLKKVKPWYEAMKVFQKSITSESIKLKLRPGEILAIDNVRLIHGRSSYSDSANKKRLIIGIHLDWDDLFSRMRALKRKIDA